MLQTIIESNENTVLSEYAPLERKSEAFQSETELEESFIKTLLAQGYTRVKINSEQELIDNLRAQLERLNNFRFTDGEWDRFFNNNLANSNEGIVEKTRKLQEDYVQTLRRDDGTSVNILLVDKRNVHNNSLQVLNQYEMGVKDGAKRDTRYDVTVLMNGFPVVHTELKRRGVPLRRAFDQIDRYQRDSFWGGSGLYEYVQIFVISNGTNTKYYSNTTRWNHIMERNSRNATKQKTSHSFEFTSFWADAKNQPITDLEDFSRTFFAKHTLLNILTKFCIFTSEDMLLVMRPYQIAAVEQIMQRINVAHNHHWYGTKKAGGYIWHTTGSGKTLTSFKTAQLATALPYIDKVLFVVDRKDLDYQTMKEYDRFEKGAANGNTSTAILTKQLEDPNTKIIITTIQKLTNFIKKNPKHPVYDSEMVIIFDECHRSQFGTMHSQITSHFRRYYLFGFTGTPIMAVNAGPNAQTTESLFGDKLHTYTIVDAIRDKNVLPFKVDYVKTMTIKKGMKDENVWDIDREEALVSPERIETVSKYILDHFDQKTYRGQKNYTMSVLTNIGDVAAKAAAETKQKQRVQGFNSLFAVASIDMAKRYYTELKRQMAEDPRKALKIAVIYSYAPNEPEESFLREEDSDDTAGLDQSSRDFLDAAINDYNLMFHTNYSTDGDLFQNYYKDVSLRMKNKELDLLIVVGMFLTGFDATTLNTLWVDKNLKLHGLIQAFSRTNRILNSIKTCGNIVCFRNLQERVDEALSQFGDANANGIVIMRPYKDYLNGYTDADNKYHRGYNDVLNELRVNFPVTQTQIPTIEQQKQFIALFSSLLRMRNLLVTFDDFEKDDELTERELQDYLSIYQDLKESWSNGIIGGGDVVSITDDVVFETEIIKSLNIDIDYILALVDKYHHNHCQDVEIEIAIHKAVDASPELRSKKGLIEAFLAQLDTVDDVVVAWRRFLAEIQEQELVAIIHDEQLQEQTTRELMYSAWNTGYLKTTGKDIDNVLPVMSRFRKAGQETREEKKQRVIEKLQAFFEKYYGLGGPANI